MKNIEPKFILSEERWFQDITIHKQSRFIDVVKYEIHQVMGFSYLEYDYQIVMNRFK